MTDLREWCKSEGVTHVAMESTGVYWKPVFNILEEGDFEIILVNPRHVRNIPGHKTDKRDSRWISKLLLSGLLQASFIPPIEIRDLRDLVRYKKKVVAQASSEKNRIIRILEDANIKLSSVLTNVDGAVGSRIIDDLIAGKTKVDQLIGHYHGKIKASKADFKLALDGRLTAHHQFMLQVIKESITDKEKLIAKIEKQIDEFAKRYSVEIELLQTIPGVAYDSAVSIIGEIGADMKRKYNSLVPRCGKKKAIVTVGHKIIIASYHVIKNKEAYKEPKLHNNPRRKKRQIDNLLNRLKELGLEIQSTEMISIT